MRVLRFVWLFLLMFLLLSPFIRYRKTITEKPVMVLALDGSASMRLHRDSVWLKQKFPELWKKAADQLEDKYSIRYLLLDGVPRETDSVRFTGRQSDLGSVFGYVRDRADEQRIAGVVLLSDGIHNTGPDPLFSNFGAAIQLHTLGFGDTSVRTDAMIKSVRCNEVVFRGNRFPVVADITAEKLKGKSLTVSVSEGGKVMETRTLKPESEHYYSALTFQLSASEPGTRHYTISVSRPEGDVNPANNSKDVFVDVIDTRYSIALIYQSPHPDLAALRAALADNPEFQVKNLSPDEAAGTDFSAHSLVILHQVPGNSGNWRSLADRLKSAKTPVWFVTGVQSVLPEIAYADPMVKVDNGGGRFTEAQAEPDPGFQAFALSSELRNAISGWPPLKTPFGNWNVSSALNTLAWQRIGAVTTRQPLMAFNLSEEWKKGYWFGEGFWRWRLRDFAENGDHRLSDELVNQTVQLLANTENRKRFRVQVPMRVFGPADPVSFSAVLYNMNYQQVKNRRVSLNLQHAGMSKAYEFSETSAGYALNIGALEPGEYRYTATAEGETEKVSGVFAVSARNPEKEQLRADFRLLRNLAARNRGAFYPAQQAEELFRKLAADNSAKPVIFSETRYADLIDLKWVFTVLAAAMAMEWFLRKREGSY